MHGAVLELVVAADVVEMGVAGNRQQWPLGNQRHLAAEADMAKSAVEQQIAIAAAHVPDVAAEERLDPRLVDQRHVVGKADRLVPVGWGDGVGHGAGSFG